jgi:hypothetical protein
MLPYNKSKIVGANPSIVRNGHGAINFYGLSVIGVNEPAQQSRFNQGSAAAALLMGPDMPGPPVFGYKGIVAMVADWPWDKDEIDTPFDQGNLWAVRTRCCSVNSGAGATLGEVDWWTAVPKVLPSGFTRRGRAGIIGGAAADLFGDVPAYGQVTWDPYYLQYTSNIVRWREAREINGFLATYPGYEWTPCNLSRVSLQFRDPSFWYNSGGSDYDLGLMRENENAATGYPPLPALRHLGWRGGRFGSTGVGGGPYAPAGTVTVSVAYGETDAPASMADVTVLWTLDFTTTPSGYVTIGPCLAPTSAAPAARKYWYFIRKTVTAAVGQRSIINITPRMSPRTDIPAWFTAVTGNKIAPGGTIT